MAEMSVDLLSESAGLKIEEASNARHDTTAAYASLLGGVDARSRRLGSSMSEAEAQQKRLGESRTAQRLLRKWLQ